MQFFFFINVKFLLQYLFFRVLIPTPPESTAASSLASSPSLSTFDEPSLVDEFADPSPSFAQMLRQNGQRSSNPWPSIKPRSSIQPVQEVNEDGYNSLRNFNPTFGDALAQALEQSSLTDAGEC